MHKINFIPSLVFEILKFKNPSIWLAKSIFAFYSRTKFFPDMRFQQNHICHYSAWFKPKNLHINQKNNFFFLAGGGREVWALSLNWGFFPKMRFHQFLTLTLNPITSYILLTYWLNWTYRRKNGKRYQFINLLLKIHGTLFFGSLKLLTFVVLHTKRKWQQILI